MLFLSDVTEVLKKIFAKRRYVVAFPLITLLLIVINLFSIVGIFLYMTQSYIGWKAPIAFGFFTRYAISRSFSFDTNDFSIFWMVSNNSLLSISILAFLAMVTSSMIASLVFTELLYVSRELKGACRLERGVGVMSSTSTLVGITSTISAASSCCGFPTVLTTLAGLIAASTASSTIGLSIVLSQIVPYLLWIGICINLFLLLITSRKISKLPAFQLIKQRSS
ncbi:MAG: hypothetical protein QXJ17_00565 [Nitrososphaeria archaeon]